MFRELVSIIFADLMATECQPREIGFISQTNG